MKCRLSSPYVCYPQICPVLCNWPAFPVHPQCGPQVLARYTAYPWSCLLRNSLNETNTQIDNIWKWKPILNLACHCVPRWLFRLRPVKEMRERKDWLMIDYAEAIRNRTGNKTMSLRKPQHQYWWPITDSDDIYLQVSHFHTNLSRDACVVFEQLHPMFLRAALSLTVSPKPSLKVYFSIYFPEKVNNGNHLRCFSLVDCILSLL